MLKPLIHVHWFGAAAADPTVEQPGLVGLDGPTGEMEPPHPVKRNRAMQESAATYDLSTCLIQLAFVAPSVSASPAFVSGR
jgi:hypothetical protein